MDNITENNKLIAEFLGNRSYLYKNDKNAMYFILTNTVGEELIINYNNDWGLLMEVVEKIESLNFVVQIHLNSCFIKELRHFINSKAIWRGKNHANTKIEAVYNACVEFIKWYNEQNKK